MIKPLLNKCKEVNNKVMKMFNSTNGIFIVNNNILVTEYSENLVCENCGHKLQLGEKFSYCPVCGYNYRERA